MTKRLSGRSVICFSSDSDDDPGIHPKLHSLSSPRGKKNSVLGKKRPCPSVDVRGGQQKVIVKRRVLRSGTFSVEMTGEGSQKEKICGSKKGKKASSRGGKNIGGGKCCEEGSDEDFKMFDNDPTGKQGVKWETNYDEEEEMVIVGERGALPLRDFAHARHDCTKYPFSTSARKDHCNKCHCFVCDCLAPCTSWGTGSKAEDHCNASDGKEKWVHIRKHHMLHK